MSTPFSVHTHSPSFVGFTVDLGLAEHREELAVGRVLQQAVHGRVDVRADERHVDAQLPAAMLLDDARGLGGEAEAGDDQFVVAHARADQRPPPVPPSPARTAVRTPPRRAAAHRLVRPPRCPPRGAASPTALSNSGSRRPNARRLLPRNVSPSVRRCGEHLREIGHQVLLVRPRPAAPVVFLLELVRRGVEDRPVLAERELLGPDALDRERPAHADDARDLLGLIDQLLLVRVGGDAGVDLVHLRAPRLAVGGDGVLERLRPVRVRVERDLPVVPAGEIHGHRELHVSVAVVGREQPAAAVGVRDGLLAVGLLLGVESVAQRVTERFADGFERLVAGLERRVEDRLMFREDRVEVRVLGDRLQRDVGDRLVREPARRDWMAASVRLLRRVVVELRGERSWMWSATGSTSK